MKFFVKKEEVQIPTKVKTKKKIYKSLKIIAVIFVVLIFFFILLIWLLMRGKVEQVDEKLLQDVLRMVSVDNIREHLRSLSSEVRLSGTKGYENGVKYIHHLWKSYNLDQVEIVSYKVLLSISDPENSSEINLLGKNSKQILNIVSNEPNLPPAPPPKMKNIYPPFNSYSPSGTVRGKLVYVNYARLSDFQLLKNKKINVKGNICLARNGIIFRANKVQLGYDFGCAGMILYPDIKDYKIKNSTVVYPESWWLPGEGVPRGTIKESNGLGDPLTPHYPSIEDAYRIKNSEAQLPKIPTHPIGYKEAIILLGYMEGEEVPKKWRGGLNVKYKFGEKMKPEIDKVELKVKVKLEEGNVSNVVGIIKGMNENDRYVVLGNHHDSWVYGAINPNSGSASFMEVVRILGLKKKEGWKPRRSILFISWGGEEQGIIGSREFVEEYSSLLGSRTVAYLNVDNGVQGTFVMKGKGTPEIYDIARNAAKRVRNPDKKEFEKGRKTIYDTWLLRNPTNNYQPKISLLGSGSDFSPFVSSLGIPSFDFQYSYDPKINIPSYPLYSTAYDDYYMFTKFHDPNLDYSKSIAHYWLVLALELSWQPILNNNLEEYVDYIDNHLHNSFIPKFQSTLKKLKINIEPLKIALKNLKWICYQFKSESYWMDKENELKVRQYNDRVMLFSRSFIDFHGIPGRPMIKNVMFAPDKYNSYNPTIFPGLNEALSEFIFFEATNETTTKMIERIKKQLAILIFYIDSAASNILEPNNFMF